jgi:hypothetical protein
MAPKFLFAAMLVALSATASAQMPAPVITEKFAVREGFAFPSNGPVRILIFRPDIKVGEQTTAGLFQTNAEWNMVARKELARALQSAHRARGLEAVMHAADSDQDSAILADYRALFRVVVRSAIRHKLFGSEPLPGKAGKFDWSLGNGVSQIAPEAKADYGLFLFSHDGFESPGRKAVQLVASLRGARDAGGAHLGYAALVDLKNGDLLWLNVDLKTTGDVRTADGAAQRVEQLLAGFPKKAGGVTP